MRQVRRLFCRKHALLVPAWGLFEAACRLDLEGIVAKRKADSYRPTAAWYKVKNPTYTQAEGRRELFERRRT